MTDPGLLRYFLGMQVKQKPRQIFLSQGKYADELLRKFDMSSCKPLATPMALSDQLSKNDGKEKSGRVYLSKTCWIVDLSYKHKAGYCARNRYCFQIHERAKQMIEVVLNNRLGKKVKVKCNEDDTFGDLKKLVATQTRADKIRIQKLYNSRTTSPSRTMRSTTAWASSCTTTKAAMEDVFY
ncbi:hypothetical protein RJ640_025941 [Escallonia rubra]|uniref:Uncharacterized protein n=1 Tax=Escallonia rubra TaxID=112253 RepID=A0AA88RMF3_9ASTE|nr:hypothetical protein RJ640_025941 [Escallonia rubra]